MRCLRAISVCVVCSSLTLGRCCYRLCVADEYGVVWPYLLGRGDKERPSRSIINVETLCAECGAVVEERRRRGTDPSCCALELI
jgi:hypothetical protein